jgi:hypothetical protein
MIYFKRIIHAGDVNKFKPRYTRNLQPGANPTTFKNNYNARDIFFLKTRYAICCVVNFYSTGVVTQGRRIGSRNSALIMI